MHTYHFPGETFDAQLDGSRLSRQLDEVREFMLANTGIFYSLAELSKHLNYPEASISARLRDLRKPQHGARLIEKRRRTVGTWEYTLRERPYGEIRPTL